jgi:tetratricopeptide (TPR) repeat protein
MHSAAVFSPSMKLGPLILFMLLAFLAAEADADPDPLAKPESAAAREHLTRGNKLYSIREFSAAIAEYKAGALMEDAPVFQYNLAQAYRLSGQYEDALWYYDRFVKRTQPTDPLKSAIEQFTAQMKAELDRAVSKQAPTEAASGGALQEAAPRVPASRREPSSSWYEDRSGWALSGSGALFVSTAAFLLVQARGLETDALSESQESRRSSLQDRASTRRVIGYVVGGVGLAVIGLGAVKLAVHHDRQGGASVTVAGQF